MAIIGGGQVCLALPLAGIADRYRTDLALKRRSAYSRCSMRLILGSRSPRRCEILRYFSIPFEQVSSHFAEELVPFEGDPIAYVSTLSKGKGISLVAHYPKAVIVTADTVVFKDGKIFNKPANREDNLTMLQELNGSWHSVFTAVTAMKESDQITSYQETRVQFHHLTDHELNLYVRAFPGEDKAGGYGIQMGGNMIVRRIEGCFYNVMGLPMSALQDVLNKVGIDLWHYLPIS
jgi:septum formation protein